MLILQIKLLPKIHMHTHLTTSYNQSLSNFYQSCHHVFDNLKILSQQDVQAILNIQLTNKPINLQKPKSISTVDKSYIPFTYGNSKMQSNQNQDNLEKTIKKNQQPDRKQEKVIKRTKLSPLWSRFNSHFSKIESTYSTLNKQWAENPEQLEKQFEQEMDLIQSLKQCSFQLHGQEKGINKLKQAQQDQNDELEELCVLRTTKKVSQASMGMYSNIVTISRFEKGREILNAPKKAKIYKKIKKIEVSCSEKQQNNQTQKQTAKGILKFHASQSIEIGHL